MADSIKKILALKKNNNNLQASKKQEEISAKVVEVTTKDDDTISLLNPCNDCDFIYTTSDGDVGLYKNLTTQVNKALGQIQNELGELEDCCHHHHHHECCDKIKALEDAIESNTSSIDNLINIVIKGSCSNDKLCSRMDALEYKINQIEHQVHEIEENCCDSDDCGYQVVIPSQTISVMIPGQTVPTTDHDCPF